LSKLDTSQEKISKQQIVTAVKDTFINRTAVSPTLFPAVFDTLLTYTEGVPVIVEYYKRRIPYINKQSGDVSFSLERAAVHSSYDLVHQFELRIKDQLNINIDPDTTETKIDGEGIIYPGFSPNIGDIFLLKLPDEQIGVFIVDLVTPLSIRKGTSFSVNFHMYLYLDNTVYDKLSASVAEELYFDKQNYFDDEITLLTDNSYNSLIRLKNVRSDIISRIINKFYHKIERTIVRPDGIYDAFIIEFLGNKISVADSRTDICQLANIYIESFPRTIWSALLNHDISEFTSYAYTLYNYKAYLWDTNISNIDDFPIVYLKEHDVEYELRRLTSVKFNANDPEPRTLSYHFSSALYYAIIRSYEDGTAVTSIPDISADMDADDRFYDNNYEEAYSFVSDQYEPLSYFHDMTVDLGSNNDMGLPELEYLIFDYLVNDNIDTTYLVDKVLAKFPFVKLNGNDQFYYFPVLIHLIDVALKRLT